MQEIKWGKFTFCGFENATLDFIMDRIQLWKDPAIAPLYNVLAGMERNIIVKFDPETKLGRQINGEILIGKHNSIPDMFITFSHEVIHLIESYLKPSKKECFFYALESIERVEPFCVNLLNITKMLVQYSIVARHQDSDKDIIKNTIKADYTEQLEKSPFKSDIDNLKLDDLKKLLLECYLLSNTHEVLPTAVETYLTALMEGEAGITMNAATKAMTDAINILIGAGWIPAREQPATQNTGAN